MKQVCVLMCTYNGEKYLREQIESVLGQKGVSVRLFVRDDGSTDQTVQILEEYRDAGQLILSTDSLHLGAANGFMELLYRAPEADYYAFCDQDDIWLQGKLAVAAEMLGSGGEAALYCSNQTGYRDGQKEGLRFSEIPNLSLTRCICGNVIAGCTMVFNSALKKCLCLPGHRPDGEVTALRMHDVWVLASAHLAGRVIYDPRSYMLYRIHEHNTVGLTKGGFFHRMQSLRRRLGTHGRSRLARELMRYEEGSEENREAVRCFAEYDRSFAGRIRLLKNRTVRRDCPEKRAVFVMKVLMGWV